MLLKMFAIFDAKVKAYAQPFYGRSTGEGVRAFEDIFTSQDPRYAGSPYRNHPADFFLYEVGTFDDDTGSVEPCKHVSLSSGANFISIDGAPPVPPVANLEAIREQMAVQRRFESSQVKKRKTRSATRKARKTSRR